MRWFDSYGGGRVAFNRIWECSDSFLFFIVQYGAGLCGLVVRVLGDRSGGPGSIPGTTRFSGARGGGKK
jgi:hypothetical protein